MPPHRDSTPLDQIEPEAAGQALNVKAASPTGGGCEACVSTVASFVDVLPLARGPEVMLPWRLQEKCQELEAESG